MLFEVSLALSWRILAPCWLILGHLGAMLRDLGDKMLPSWQHVPKKMPKMCQHRRLDSILGSSWARLGRFFRQGRVRSLRVRLLPPLTNPPSPQLKLRAPLSCNFTHAELKLLALFPSSPASSFFSSSFRRHSFDCSIDRFLDLVFRRLGPRISIPFF